MQLSDPITIHFSNTQDVITILELLGQIPTEYKVFPIYENIETQLYAQLPELNPEPKTKVKNGKDSKQKN